MCDPVLAPLGSATATTPILSWRWPVVEPLGARADASTAKPRGGGCGREIGAVGTCRWAHLLVPFRTAGRMLFKAVEGGVVPPLPLTPTGGSPLFRSRTALRGHPVTGWLVRPSARNGFNGSYRLSPDCLWQGWLATKGVTLVVDGSPVATHSVPPIAHG